MENMSTLSKATTCHIICYIESQVLSVLPNNKFNHPNIANIKLQQSVMHFN